jgi:hypothetical protein
MTPGFNFQRDLRNVDRQVLCSCLCKFSSNYDHFMAGKGVCGLFTIYLTNSSVAHSVDDNYRTIKITSRKGYRRKRS